MKKWLWVGWWCVAAAVPVWAQSTPATDAVKVEAAWARATVPGQKGTGAFMTLTAAQDMTLVGVSASVAGVAQLHEMRMEGDVMRMQNLPALALPAGQAVALVPGGNHLMLQDLKVPLSAGSRVTVTLRLQDAKGTVRQQEVVMPVAVKAPGNAPADTHQEHHHQH